MARFDVYKLKSGGYVLDCQADILSHYSSRFVVPLLNTKDGVIAASRLNPTFQVEGETMLMYTHFAAAIPLADLGPKIISLEHFDLEIIAALDMLVSGY
jgi:toxin CcdB